ncbi:pentapeptide repeat-containing protein [Lacticaseibacillus zhaodongensis]|uniref:pentapeptide repeat-containing protein n=1 Tax=Lacticaseibacillus zhaodongensis TaxID=2668065 RepID=UPI0012D32C55|nr:pentapeptide repeat-containing protein [Lacticaseibacillus zhaodongensis]
MTDPDEIKDQTLTLDDCTNEHRYLNCILTGSLEPVHLASVQFDHCTFQGDCTHTELLDCSLTHCNLANSDWNESVLSGVQFTSCRLTGISLTACRLIQCALRDCTASMLNLSESTLEKTTITGCDLHEASMQAVVVKPKLVLDDCNLDGADLTDSNLAKWDLSGASFSALMLSPDRIRGLKIASWQAPALVAVLGVRVK